VCLIKVEIIDFYWMHWILSLLWALSWKLKDMWSKEKISQTLFKTIFNQNWYVSSLGCWTKLFLSYHHPCICYIFLFYQGSQYVIHDVRFEIQRHEGYESLWGMTKWHKVLWRNMIRKWLCLCSYRFTSRWKHIMVAKFQHIKDPFQSPFLV
jgi:hypothetical protein